MKCSNPGLAVWDGDADRGIRGSHDSRIRRQSSRIAEFTEGEVVSYFVVDYFVWYARPGVAAANLELARIAGKYPLWRVFLVLGSVWIFTGHLEL